MQYTKEILHDRLKAVKVLKNSFDQFLVIYLIVIVSFMVAEHFHIAGILSIVASVLAFKYLVQKELKRKQTTPVKSFEDEEDIESSLIQLVRQVPALSKKDFREYKKESEYIGIFANAIVFIIVANIIDFNLILKYTYEILVIFTITSILRFIAMSGLTLNLKLPFRWAKALTFSGAKGALAIIMVHSLPENFIYKEMFDAIVVGNVLLTTFIYTIALMIHISKNKDKYKQDHQQSDADETNHLAMDLVSLIEKDHQTGVESEHCVRTLHSEQNAILQAAKRGIALNGAELYCWMTPCPICAMFIVQVGIKKVNCVKRYQKGQILKMCY